jgi:hypothetical protein
MNWWAVTLVLCCALLSVALGIKLEAGEEA